MSDIVQSAAKELFSELDEKGVFASIEGQTGPDYLSEEEVVEIIAKRLRSFLMQYWPDVQSLSQGA